MRIIFLIISITFSKILFANIDEFLNRYQVKQYSPINYGLKDLKVKVEIDGLTEKLNEQLVFGKLKKVYFFLYWKAPNKINAEIIGMPNGFGEVKDRLIQGVLLRSDFLVPTALKDKIASFENKLLLEKGKTSIVSTDPKGSSQYSEIIYLFDKNDKMTKTVLKSPLGMEYIDLNFKKFSWSQNKLVLESYDLEKNEGVSNIKTKVKVKYLPIGGHGLPETITVDSKQTLTQPVGKKNQTYDRNFSSTLRFSDYELNTGLKNVSFD